MSFAAHSDDATLREGSSVAMLNHIRCRWTARLNSGTLYLGSPFASELPSSFTIFSTFDKTKLLE